MVVISHFFFFLEKTSGADVTRASHIGPYLELSISRQPHDICNVFLAGTECSRKEEAHGLLYQK